MSAKFWSREESRERFSGPISPLGWSLLRTPTDATLAAMNRRFGVRVAAPEEVSARIGGYVYARKSLFKNLSAWRFRAGFLAFHFLKTLVVCVAAMIRGLVAAVTGRRAFREDVVLTMASAFSRRSLSEFISSWDSRWTRLQDGMAKDPVVESREMTFDEFERCREELERETREFFAEDFTVYFFKNFSASLIRGLLKGRGLSAKDAEAQTRALAQGLAQNFSVKLALDVSRGESAESLNRKYGHLTDDWDLRKPFFAERPGVFGARAASRDLEGDFKKRCEERTALEKKWTDEFQDRRWDFFVWSYQKCVLIDEDLRALSSRQYPSLRKLFRGVARSPAWIKTGLPEADLYFLSLEEIREGLRKRDFSALAEEIGPRELELQRAEETTPPEEIEEFAPGRYRAVAVTGKVAKKGQGVSGGRARGPALPVRHFDDLKRLTPAHVLILTNPTPVYAAYYTSCAGLLSETGGSLSHGAIVAREFGIPMVTGLTNALTEIAEGTVIEIDGDSGEVRVIG